jgi:hypothetical protein
MNFRIVTFGSRSHEPPAGLIPAAASITNETFEQRQIRSGSPGTAMMSASLPASTVPTLILPAEQFRIHARRRLDRLHRCHAGLDEQRKFAHALLHRKADVVRADDRP